MNMVRCFFLILMFFIFKWVLWVTWKAGAFFYVYPTVTSVCQSNNHFVPISRADFQFINTQTKLAIVSRIFQKFCLRKTIRWLYREKREIPCYMCMVITGSWAVSSGWNNTYFWISFIKLLQSLNRCVCN